MNRFNNQLLDAASFKPYLFKAPSAWLGHLPFAAWLTREFKPEVFVELGSHRGHSYFSFCQTVQESSQNTKCYAVDTWRGDEHAGNYGEEVYCEVNDHNQKHYTSFSRLLRMTFDEALVHFPDASVDLLHIDGLHTYEAVKHDFNTWLPKLKPGAIVLFHDTNVRERGFGVWRLWEELQNQFPNNIEFSHAYGLGVLQIPCLKDAKMQDWLNPKFDDIEHFKQYFEALGAVQVERFNLNASNVELTSNLMLARQLEEDLRHQVAHLKKNNSDMIVENLEQLSQLNMELNDARSLYRVTINSVSWRITKPLRGILRLLPVAFKIRIKKLLKLL